VPLLIGDERTAAVAAAHAGWRGLAAGVPSAAVSALAHESAAAHPISLPRLGRRSARAAMKSEPRSGIASRRRGSAGARSRGGSGQSPGPHPETPRCPASHGRSGRGTGFSTDGWRRGTSSRKPECPRPGSSWRSCARRAIRARCVRTASRARPSGAWPGPLDGDENRGCHEEPLRPDGRRAAVACPRPARFRRGRAHGRRDCAAGGLSGPPPRPWRCSPAGPRECSIHGGHART